MKLQIKLLFVLLMITVFLGLTACGSSSSKVYPANATKPPPESSASALASPSPTPDKIAGIKIKVTVGEHVLTATLLDNATTRSLIAKFPLTVRMADLYSREMCYRFPDPLPANEALTNGYEVGDISYWTPRHSFVIFYKQNGEVISNLQKIGRLNSGVEVFEKTGDVDVTFELLEK